MKDDTIKKFLQSVIKTKPIFLNQYIEDRDVLSFDFKNFNLFTNALKSGYATAIRRSCETTIF